MLDLFYTFISYFFNIVDFLAYYVLLSHKLTSRFSKKTQLIAYCITYLLWFSAELSTKIFPNIPLKLLFLLLFFFALLTLYKDNLYKKVLWIICTFFIIFLGEIITIPIALLITGSSLQNIAENSGTQVLGLILSRLLIFLIIFFLIRSSKRISNYFTKEYFSIILVDVLYTLSISTFFYFNNLYLSTDIAITLSIFVMLLISCLALYLLKKITKKSEEIMLTNLKMQQTEMEHKQNEDMTIVVNDLRSLRHDMNNHMSVLQGLLAMQEYDDAKNYLSTITEELAVANSFIFTDNKVLSVMLNNKISKAHQFGITFDTELLTSTTPFSDSDLCAVVGNILENAFEASSKHKDPYIHFMIKKTDNQFVIECQNNYVVAPVFEKGNLVTTKSDKSYHGIGTKTIRSIVDSYHGITTFTVDDLFCVKIVIPI